MKFGNISATLVFALLYSHALSGLRNSTCKHWRRLKHAIHKIKEVRNTVLSHACKTSIPGSTFTIIFDKIEEAVEDLLTRSDPLVGKLKALRTENEFVTDDVAKYKKLLQEDHKNLLLLDQDLKRLECKVNISEHVTFTLLLRHSLSSCIFIHIHTQHRIRKNKA